jgi:hypothetical protein
MFYVDAREDKRSNVINKIGYLLMYPRSCRSILGAKAEGGLQGGRPEVHV